MSPRDLSVKILEMGTGILNRRHFVFYHGDAPCFKLDILNLNFPPHRYKNTILNLKYYQFLVGLEVECPAGTREVPGSSSGDPQSKKKTFLHFPTKSGGKLKVSMSNLEQGASPW